MVDNFFIPGYVIQAVTLTDDGGGAKTESWADNSSLGSLGYLRDVTGRERILNAKLGVESTHKLFRPSGSVTEKNRVKDTNDSNKIYEIKFVKHVKNFNNDIDHLELDLLKVA